MVEGNKISSMIENPCIMHKDESIYISNILEDFPYFQTAIIVSSIVGVVFLNGGLGAAFGG